MSDIRVDLESIQVIDGQGVGEGDFEIRIQVQEGPNNLVWPSFNGYTRIDKLGPAYTINREVGTYAVGSGKLTKRFAVDVTEVDSGTLGGDDIGQGIVTLELTPDMAPVTGSATLSLKRPNMKKLNGKVKVVLSAQRVN